MSAFETLRARNARFWNRIAARRAVFARPATALVFEPEPRCIGYIAKGQALLHGDFRIAGHTITGENRSLWQLSPTDPGFLAELHGFGWLDDLAAVGDARARLQAQAWMQEWIERYGRGQGPGWSPEVTGHRVIRMVQHALFLHRGRKAEDCQPYFRSIAIQARFLARRAHAAPVGLPRFEAYGALVLAALVIEGLDGYLEVARRGLAAQCHARIDDDGGIPTRNPESLLEIFSLLTWVSEALAQAGQPAEPAVVNAMTRIAPVLRALRHADGGLARFQGGGRGMEGRLDAALAESGIKRRVARNQAMGYARLAAGRSTVILDAAAPPRGRGLSEGYASTLAFEFTVGRRPLIVSTGPGTPFGPDWKRNGRSTAAHSTLTLAGQSSATLAQPRVVAGRLHEPLIGGPRQVPLQMSQTEDGAMLEAGHDGFVAEFGLSHARSLTLAVDGGELYGEDYLVALEDGDKKRLDRAMAVAGQGGIGFRILFHVHPEVQVTEGVAGAALHLTLPSGEIWKFEVDGPVEVGVAPSLYLEDTRPRPIQGNQVVFTGRTIEYATRIRWSISRVDGTARPLRDLTEGTSDQAY